MRFSGIIAGASNVRGGDNPPFTAEDFQELYPQFFTEDGTPHVPRAVLDMYIEYADAVVKITRFRESWLVGMSLFIAHFLTLYMQSMTANNDPQAVMAAGQLKGLVTSKSAGDVSRSYDYSTAISDLEGWADWKLTTYGVQFAALAKRAGKGGMYIR